MKRGLIVINAYSALAPVLNQAERLKHEFGELQIEADVKTCAEIYAGIDDSGSAFANVDDYGFCVYLDKDKYLSAILEKAGLKLFNSHAAVQACDDKMQTQLLLSGSGTPMPATLSAPLCYTQNAEPDKKFLDRAEDFLGYPVIVKTCYGSRGEGVFKADNRAQLEQLAKKLLHTPHIYQRFIKESAGKDIRVIVIGGKVKAAMQRIAKSGFRSNLELGGTGVKYDCPADMKELCEKTASLLGLDYCGIDVLTGKKNYICEVNSNAFFTGIERVTGVNVAKLYTRHILKQLKT